MTLNKLIISFMVLWSISALPANGGSPEAIERDAQITAPVKKAPEFFVLQELERHPLRPPDTSSPRATLRSFLDNINAAYQLLMSAHEDNMNSPGIFTPPSIREQGQMANRLMQRAIHCLDLSEVPEALKKSWGYEGAIFLKEIIDRIQLPPWKEIPATASRNADNTSDAAAALIRWQLPNT
jgi:MscS family membrane protein